MRLTCPAIHVFVIIVHIYLYLHIFPRTAASVYALLHILSISLPGYLLRRLHHMQMSRASLVSLVLCLSCAFVCFCFWQIICEINFMQTCRQNTTTWQFNWTRHVAGVSSDVSSELKQRRLRNANRKFLLIWNSRVVFCQRPRTLHHTSPLGHYLLLSTPWWMSI